jgi:ferredoxin
MAAARCPSRRAACPWPPIGALALKIGCRVFGRRRPEALFDPHCRRCGKCWKGCPGIERIYDAIDKHLLNLDHPRSDELIITGPMTGARPKIDQSPGPKYRLAGSDCTIFDVRQPIAWERSLQWPISANRI